MPKMKPHSGMKKRIKTTGTGKLRREQTNHRHYLEWKPSKQRRRLEGEVDVAKSDTKRVKKLLGK